MSKPCVCSGLGSGLGSGARYSSPLSPALSPCSTAPLPLVRPFSIFVPPRPRYQPQRTLSLLPRLVSSRLVSSRLVSPRLVSSRLVSSRLVSSCLVLSCLSLSLSLVRSTSTRARQGGPLRRHLQRLRLPEPDGRALEVV